ncbi:LapA family protein [Vagococcus coleopterorum]|uniref:LapA family protein n=1 Tax=Vagococcus coleopterorum TaxID=2714946 RepID=A0A6G8AN89_9ENTE|nr:LapA family protein [Vagococcus coleopterorum]QIL46466.1 LapA family protein [Vagococcus coleopterorum]
MREQGKLIFSFILVGFIAVFSVINIRPTRVNFGFAEFEFPLIYVILGSAVVGALIVGMSLFSSYWKQRKKIKRLEEEIKEAEQGVEGKVLASGAELYAQIAAKDQKIVELERQVKIYAEGYTQPIQLSDIDEHIAD